MLEKNKCPSCKCIYEVSWDDRIVSYNIDDDDDDVDFSDSECEPQYCPFCGTHCEYSDIDIDDDDYDDI
jgi:hypothetical protein